MELIWVVNVQLPEISKILGNKPSHFGGWLINSAELLKQNNINITILFPLKRANIEKIFYGENINYIAFNPIKDNDVNSHVYYFEFEYILNKIKPDVVHIHGTELAHSLAMVNICNKMHIKSVISIQGLVSKISIHTYSHLPLNVIYGFTLRNLVLNDSVYSLKRKYYKRGLNEVKTIANGFNFIGRTTWDKACVKQINTKANYFFCNEILREEFYHGKWDIDTCERNTIFITQGQYPIKGLHILIEAMVIITKNFPNTKLSIGGSFNTRGNSIKEKLFETYYIKYLKKKIKKYKLTKNIVFTGPLSSQQVVNQLHKTHVFVCSSTIENSPNSLGEALLIGVPSVASYVGGIPDMIEHGVNGYLYQSDAPYMLAHFVCEIFNNDSIARYISANAIHSANNIHNRESNIMSLLNIYNQISSNDDSK